MSIYEIEQKLRKRGACTGPPMADSQKEPAGAGHPRAYVADGIFVKPINEEVRIKIHYADIVWVEADNNSCHIHLSVGSFVSVGYNIMSLEKMLPGQWFVRVNRSEIVNICQVYKFCGNTLYLEGSNHLFTVSKSNRGFSRS